MEHAFETISFRFVPPLPPPFAHSLSRLTRTLCWDFSNLALTCGKVHLLWLDSPWLKLEGITVKGSSTPAEVCTELQRAAQEESEGEKKKTQKRGAKGS